MKRYESYKDSGVKWLGEIPGHWEVIRLKALLIERIEKNNNKENLIILSLLKDKGIIPYDEKGAIGNNSKEDLSQYKIARKGDLVINSMNVIIGSVGITQYDGYISPAYYSFKPKGIINLIYYYYLMTLRSVQQSIRCYSKGIMEIRLRITSNDFLSMPFPFPPKSEQTAIANYLDSVTSKIDEAISQQKKMIDLLNERKQIIIQNAVTKGLDPNAKMKDSGVEWIGEIPEDWEVLALKYCCSLKARIGWNGLKSEEFEEYSYAYLVTGQDFKGSMINWKKCYQINQKRYEEDPYIQINNGDLLITKDGTIGKIAKVINLDKPACLNSGIFVIKQTKKMYIQDYLFWMLSSSVLKEFNRFTQTGATIAHLYQNVFEQMPCVLPCVENQIEISTYLNRETSKIDSSISQCNKMIFLLQERKQIIINDVVTGKVKVI